MMQALQRRRSSSSSSSSEKKKEKKKKKDKKEKKRAAQEAGGDAEAKRPREDGKGEAGAAEKPAAPTGPAAQPCVLLKGFPGTWTEREVRMIFAAYGGVDDVQ